MWQGQCLEHRLGLGVKYAYLPRVSDCGSVISDQLSVFLKNNNFAFIRIESVEKWSLITGHRSLVKNRQPRATLILDLTQTEDALLQSMHSKTRYNISLAERKGVVAREKKNINVFWKLNEATIARDKFKSHNKNYYAKMLETEMCRQLTAYFNGQPIAAILLIIFGDACVYLHGASSNEERNLMAPYLLQWRGIQLAKQLGCKYYDFWGIAPASKVGEPSTCFHNLCWEVGHRWTGVTRFKAGFGGKTREYPQAVDVVLNKSKYYVYLALRRVLGILKGLLFNQ